MLEDTYGNALKRALAEKKAVLDTGSYFLNNAEK